VEPEEGGKESAKGENMSTRPLCKTTLLPQAKGYLASIQGVQISL
jgi:hypothetical protein